MKKLTFALSGLVFGIYSCSYLAGEAASNYIASGGKIMSYVENRPVSSTVVGHGAVLGAGIILNTVLSFWAHKKENANLRKLAYDCLMNKPEDNPYWSEDFCKVVAKQRLERKTNFFLSVNAGECKKSFFNPFAAFRKCWNEGFTYLEENLEEDENLKEVLFQVYFDDYLIGCMPDPKDYVGKEQELQRKYFACREKAKKEAEEAIKEVEPKLKEYLAKSS